MLAEVVEKLKNTGLQAAPPAHCYAGPGDVACDSCTGRKRKAVKSCLVCLASYCDTHLKLHDALHPGKRHKLIDASGNLQEMICSHHDKLLEVYCQTDQQCICYLCTMDKHSGHKTVSPAAERTEKQKQLGATQSKFQQRIQEREKELQDLRQAMQSLKRSAQAAVDDSERIFTELISSIERRRSEVKELIRDQEKAAVSRAERLLERLEQEIAEMRRRDAEMEQLSHTEDHIHFLQTFQSLCVPPGPGNLPSITARPHVFFEALKESFSELKKQLEDLFKVEMVNISKSVKEVHAAEPCTREDFLQYSCQLTLDPNTVNQHLCLSEGNREVTHVAHIQLYPAHPERFECLQNTSYPLTWDPNTGSYIDPYSYSGFGYNSYGMSGGQQNTSYPPTRASNTRSYIDPYSGYNSYGMSGDQQKLQMERLKMYAQVLCREGLSGCCYWEAECSGDGEVSIAVSYKEISRQGQGDEGIMGNNDKSWSLRFSNSNGSFWYNNVSTGIPVPPSSRIGVYLDHRAGTLSFYSVSDTMTLLHRVQTTFTQPLYPGFWVWRVGSSVKLCDQSE